MKVKAGRGQDDMARLGAAIERAVKAWFRAQCEAPGASFFIYFRRARENEALGDIAIAMESPSDEWELASGERVSPAWTIERATSIVGEHSRSLPVFNPSR